MRNQHGGMRCFRTLHALRSQETLRGGSTAGLLLFSIHFDRRFRFGAGLPPACGLW